MNLESGILFILGSQLIWGISPVIVKFIPLQLPSALLLAARLLPACIPLLIIILVNKKYASQLKKLDRRTIFQIMILGLIGSGVADLLMIQAIRTSGVILAVMIARLEIPLGVILAGVFLHEKITPRIIVATILSFLGVIFISYNDIFSNSHISTLVLGIGFALIAAFLWACTGVYAKKLLTNNTSPIILTLGRLLSGGLFNLILSVVTLQSLVPHFHGLNLSNWLSLLFLAFFSSALAFFLYYSGLEKMPAAKSSILLTISIVIAIFTGVLIGETLTLFQWGGVIAIGGSIYLTIKPEK